MRNLVESLIYQAITAAQADGSLGSFEIPDAGVERPADTTHGDWSATVALRSAKAARRAPKDIAQAIIDHLPADGRVDHVELAGPGFINFYLTVAAKASVIDDIRTNAASFGQSKEGEGKRVQVEFVSANPVGPMHVGHGRWAALGDSLCRVLEHAGWDVSREFYINDAGIQMDVFARSINARYLQLLELIHEGKSLEEAYDFLEDDRAASCEPDQSMRPFHQAFLTSLNEEAYGGEYIIDLAKRFVATSGESLSKLDEESRLDEFREQGYQAMMENIREVLAASNVVFDVYFSERTLHERDVQGTCEVDHAIERLREAGYIYEKDEATWFASTAFGDDKDRVLIKADGSYTYFAPDIAYHANKFDRGFDRVINIWGADHHGYVARMQAAMAALGHAGQLDILLGQLVNLERDGLPVRMSKRRGTMITFEELLHEVGVDATRYTLVSRSTDQEIDFDIELVKRQSSDNPVYYVQYAHARICSILRKAAGVEVDESSDPLDVTEVDNISASRIPKEVNLSLLSHVSEQELLGVLDRFGEVVEAAARDLAPFKLTHYCSELAAAYHGFYTNCHVLTDDSDLTDARLALSDASRRVLALALSLIGVTAPVRM